MSRSGQLEGQMHDIRQRLKQMSLARVIESEIVGRHLEVAVELVPSGQKCWAELVVPGGGPGGALVRIPAPGDTMLAAMPDGDRNEALLLGWVPTDAAMPLPDGIDSGTLYIQAPTGVPTHIDGQEVRLGRGATAKVARADRVEAELRQIKTALDTIATAANAANSYVSVGETGCDKVKGE